jgi:ketosteroid isomerase-like protein
VDDAEGVAAIRDLWVSYFGAFEGLQVILDDVVDFGNGVILANNRHVGRLIGGAALAERRAFVYEFVGGRVVKTTDYTDIDAARAAAERLAEERGYAVSQENVEIVRRAVAAFSRHDADAMWALYDPDVELDWSSSVGWVAGVYRGLEEVRRFWAEYFDAFDEIAAEVKSYTPAGDSVVVPNVARLRGRDGIEVTAESTLIFSLRDGKITRVRLYQKVEDALKAVGLEE